MGVGLLFGLFFTIALYKLDDATRKWARRSARRRREKRWPDLEQK